MQSQQRAGVANEGYTPRNPPQAGIRSLPCPISPDVRGDSIFDFSKNEILTVEKIIRSTFANPDRRKFAESSFKNRKYPLAPATVGGEDLIMRISHEIPKRMVEMNRMQIELNEVRFLDGDIDRV